MYLKCCIYGRISDTIMNRGKCLTWKSRVPYMLNKVIFALLESNILYEPESLAQSLHAHAHMWSISWSSTRTFKLNWSGFVTGPSLSSSHNSCLHLLSRAHPEIPIVALAASTNSAPSLFCVKKFAELCLQHYHPHSYHAHDISTLAMNISNSLAAWRTFTHSDRRSK